MNEVLFYLSKMVIPEIASFCFLNDIDPIFEELDSIYSPFYLIGSLGFDNYLSIWK